MLTKAVLLVTVLVYLKEASGHGMMLVPLNRGSLWRDYKYLQPHYNDNEFFCGGVPVQFGQNEGRCGPCGDNWADPAPRSNENTGTFGNGVVVRTYAAGSIVNTSVTLTANHQGTFVFSLCVLTDVTKPETEDCFNNLPLADGRPIYRVNPADYTVRNQVQLPADLTCERCVLRWHYESGNSWGICDDGSQGVGCGPQETFRSCADISIV